jgi:UDP-2,3-diacylglucosamine pyrophosphatase LpxH
MIVIVSDLHLTDGSSGTTTNEHAFRAFRERLRDLAFDASKRADGIYKPLESLDVILLGDILDVTRSDKWCSSPPDVRPWGNPHDPRVEMKVREITEAILKHNRNSLAVLRSLVDGKVITVPPATAKGKVALVSRDPGAAERVPVKVCIHYLVGNHDWMYHLPGEGYEAIRGLIRHQLALANPEGPFPHDPRLSPQLARLFLDHRLFARHGDIFDPINFRTTRDASSLGDAIVIELLTRFPQLVYDRLGSSLSEECRKGLRELDNVRPLEIIPVWLHGLLRNTCTKEQAREIMDIWNRLAEDFLQIPFVKECIPFWYKLGVWLTEGISLGALSRLVLQFKRRLQRHDSFAAYALQEDAFKNGTADRLVYGHTHRHEVVVLRGETRQHPRKQIYINSGTWRAVHDLARFDINAEEFAGYQVMTYLAFFKDDEHEGSSFDCWSGALDI